MKLYYVTSKKGAGNQDTAPPPPPPMGSSHLSMWTFIYDIMIVRAVTIYSHMYHVQYHETIMNTSQAIKLKWYESSDKIPNLAPVNIFSGKNISLTYSVDPRSECMFSAVRSCSLQSDLDLHCLKKSLSGTLQPKS